MVEPPSYTCECFGPSSKVLLPSPCPILFKSLRDPPKRRRSPQAEPSWVRPSAYCRTSWPKNIEIQDGPRRAKVGPKTPQDATTTAQDAPKLTPERSKPPPRRPKTCPSRPQDAPRHFGDLVFDLPCPSKFPANMLRIAEILPRIAKILPGIKPRIKPYSRLQKNARLHGAVLPDSL